MPNANKNSSTGSFHASCRIATPTRITRTIQPYGSHSRWVWLHVFHFEAMQEQTTQHLRIPVNFIDRGNNPRKHFDEAHLNDLANSIKQIGVLQPILVRPTDNGRFQIVAGERRYRATILAYGNDDSVTIPVMVRSMSDEEADRAALTENVEREKMSTLDESESAARILGACKGDRDEAARMLGWNRTTLDRRLSLMYAIPSVRDALRNDEITLGHAELLAVLRKESQEVALSMLMKQEKRPSVPAFKDMLERMALSLEKAIFGKEGCQNCQFNTGNQQALFTETLTAGNCTNKQCYDQKTDAHLEVLAESLRDDYQVVRIIRPGDNFTIIPLRADGAKGVGTEQAQACRSCQNFGAAVSAVPDKLGQVYKDQCSDTACNVRMVAARIKAETAAKAPPQTSAETPTKATGQGGQTESAKAPASNAKPARAAAAPASLSNAVKTYREEVWRAIFKRVVQRADVVTNRAVLLAIVLHRPSVLSSRNLSEDTAALGLKHTETNVGKLLADCLSLENAQLSAALSHVAASASADLEIQHITGILETLEVKIEQHWQLNAEFLGRLTKNEIDTLCTELGIKTVLDGQYAKLLAGKKDDFVKGVLEIKDFDYIGLIPKAMKWPKG